MKLHDIAIGREFLVDGKRLIVGEDISITKEAPDLHVVTVRILAADVTLDYDDIPLGVTLEMDK